MPFYSSGVVLAAILFLTGRKNVNGSITKKKKTFILLTFSSIQTLDDAP